MPSSPRMAALPMAQSRGDWEISAVRPGAHVGRMARRYQIWLRKTDGSSLRIFKHDGFGSEDAARQHALDTANTVSP